MASHRQLGRIALASQGLTSHWPFGRGLSGTQRAIEHLGYVQIDAISVINRAHLHTLWNRVPDFSESHLDRLIERRKVFEYWFHAASYLPMRDFRFALPRMHALKNGKRHWGLDEDVRVLRSVMERIQIEGPLKARELTSKRPKGSRTGWWDFGPIKRALTQLQMQGDLIVVGRGGFEKSYELPERVIPAGIETRMPSTEELAEHLVDTGLRAQGIVGASELVHLRRDNALRRAVLNILKEKEADGSLVKLVIAGAPYHAVAERLERLVRVARHHVRLLSPFDNALIHRRRTRNLHGFDYVLECYVEASKRRFGYFCLPVLFGDSFVGRADCKAHRDQGLFEVKHLCIEHPPRDMALFRDSFTTELKRIADWHNCPDVRITLTTPSDVRVSAA